MVMAAGMGDAVLRERLPALWRRIEDAHYTYLETDDSPEKLQQKKKLEGYIMEYLSLVPHECKFGLAETTQVFERTVTELSEFSAYRAGAGWAAIATYAANLLAQPWRNEYKTIRLYCGYYKHEVEANMVGAECLLSAMGYKPAGRGRVSLEAPVCPDMVGAISRDALIAQCECQIMCQIWESVWGSGGRTTWLQVYRERLAHAASPHRAAANLQAQLVASTVPYDGSEIYANVPVTSTADTYRSRHIDTRYNNEILTQNSIRDESPLEDTITPVIHPQYVMPNMVPQMMYPMPHHMRPEVPVTVPMMTPYGVPYYYPIQAPYMLPTPVYAPIKHATTMPINGYPHIPQYRYPTIPTVPTGQLIELDTPCVYENGKYEDRIYKRNLRKQEPQSRRNSTSKSGFSDVSLPSLPRSDTQPALSKAREDGMGTYESWDYVFRNLSSKDQDGDSRSRFSPSLDRDSRTLDRLDREERRAKYQPTTLDLEDGLQALNLDRSYDEDMYRTAKVNENLMRLKQDQEKKAKLAKKASEERKTKRHIEPIPNPKSDALINSRVAADKIRLLSKKDVKDRKDVIKQQNSVNGSSTNVAEVKKTKWKPVEVDRSIKSKPVENGVHATQASKNSPASNSSQPYDLKAQLIVSLDEPDFARRSPPKQMPIQNGVNRTVSRASDRSDAEVKPNKWECGTCTYLNRADLQACEMCGKSKRGPEIQPLTSGGRECPACTLVNKRDATVCDACGTSLEHCPTYI